jgi:hypothetical protein
MATIGTFGCWDLITSSGLWNLYFLTTRTTLVNAMFR